MKITTTTDHDIRFTVEAFWGEEGGMGTDSFGSESLTLAEAVHTLELARARDAKVDWVIVGKVKTTVS